MDRRTLEFHSYILNQAAILVKIGSRRRPRTANLRVNSATHLPIELSGNNCGPRAWSRPKVVRLSVECSTVELHEAKLFTQYPFIVRFFGAHRTMISISVRC